MKSRIAAEDITQHAIVCADDGKRLADGVRTRDDHFDIAAKTVERRPRLARIVGQVEEMLEQRQAAKLPSKQRYLADPVGKDEGDRLPARRIYTHGWSGAARCSVKAGRELLDVAPGGTRA